MQCSQFWKEIKKEGLETEDDDYRLEIVDKLNRLKYKEYANKKLNKGGRYSKRRENI